MSNTIEILINATDNASDKLDKVGSGLQTFGSSVQSATQPLADLAAQLAVLEGAMVTVAGAIVGKAIDAADKFNTQFGEISTMISGPKESLGGFKNEIMDYANQSTQSIESINKSVYSAISMGANYSDSLKAVGVAEKLATAGKSDLDSTLKVLMGSLNAYGEGMGSAAKYSDILFSTVAQGNTTLPELGSSLSQVTSIAASTGVGFDELMAAIATLTSAGMPTAQAITSIKAAISGLSVDTGSYAEAADKMGIKMGVASLQSKGLAGMIEEVRQKTGGSEEKIKSLFGSIEAYGAVVGLAGTSNGKFNSSLNEMKNSAGATSAAFEKMEQNINQLLSNNIDTFFIKLGDGLDQSADDMKLAMSTIFDGLGKGVDAGAFDPIKNALKDAMADISAELTKVGKNLPDALKGVDFSGIVEIIEDASRSIKQFFRDIGSDNPDKLRQTIQSVVDTFEGLSRVFSAVVTGFSPVLSVLKEAIQWFADLDPQTQALIGGFIGLGTALNTFAPYLTTIGTGFSALASSYDLLKGASLATLGQAFTSLGSALAGFSPILVAAAAGFAGWKLGEWAVENVPAVTSIKDGLTDLMESVFGLSGAQEASTGAEDLARQIENLSKKTGDATITAENYREKLRAYMESQKESAAVTKAAADPLGTLDAKLKDLSRTYMEQSEELAKMKEAGLEGTEGYEALEEAMGNTKKEMDETSGVIKELTEAQGKSTEGFGEQAVKAEELKTKIAELGKTYAQQTVELDQMKEAGKEGTAEYQALEEAMNGTKTELDATVGALDEMGRAQEEAAKKTAETTAATTKQSSELEGYKEKVKSLNQTYADQGVELAKLEASGKKGTTEWQNLKDAMKKTEDQIDKTNGVIGALEKQQAAAEGKTIKLHDTLKDLSNDQKIKLIESKINLNAEQVKADAQKVIAAFESINTTIKATGDVMSGALGKLGEGDYWTDNFLKDVIKEELAIQKESAKRQNELLDTQIKNLEAKTAALERGDAMIKIDAAGLEPELEAFMWKIMEKVQLRVNEEGLEFLLGSATGTA